MKRRSNTRERMRSMKKSMMMSMKKSMKMSMKKRGRTQEMMEMSMKRK
jgi:hypothetical protein